LGLFASVIAVAATTPTVAGPPVADIDAIASLEPDEQNGLYVYQLCADCHTPQGWGRTDGSVPVLAGQHRRVLIKQIADIRDGHRDNAAMFSFAQDAETGGDQAIADVTHYIAELPVPPKPGVGPGQGLERAGRIFRAECESCHGEDGVGNDERLVPRLKGQHYGYLKRQMEWIASGERENADPQMVEVVSNLEKVELEQIADYLSRRAQEPELVAPTDWQNPDFNYGIQ
jgi:cytochrome c553